MNSLGGTPIYLLSFVVQIVTFVLLIRMLLQCVQADFFNPISQTVFKLSAPVVDPLGKLLPKLAHSTSLPWPLLFWSNGVSI